MTETEAIERLRLGDISGLERLVQQYYVPAVRAVYIVSRDRALAEDIVQSAFLRVYERIDQYDASRPFAPWFLRSVVNDAGMAARHEMRLVPLDALSPGGEDVLPLPNNPDPQLDDLLVSAETSAAIWEALGKLTVEQRAAIVLRYYLDLSEAEMSARMDCPPGTIKSRLHTARHRLRKLLPEWLAPGTE